MTPPVVPINSVGGIEALILFGLQVFAQVYNLFDHSTLPIVPTSAAPQVIATLHATPGLTEEHKAIITSAVTDAAAAAEKQAA